MVLFFAWFFNCTFLGKKLAYNVELCAYKWGLVENKPAPVIRGVDADEETVRLAEVGDGGQPSFQQKEPTAIYNKGGAVRRNLTATKKYLQGRPAYTIVDKDATQAAGVEQLYGGPAEESGNILQVEALRPDNTEFIQRFEAPPGFVWHRMGGENAGGLGFWVARMPAGRSLAGVP